MRVDLKIPAARLCNPPAPRATIGPQEKSK